MLEADLPVLTRWEVADLRWASEQGAPACYVLTNTRSLDPADAGRRNVEVTAPAGPRTRPRSSPITSDAALLDVVHVLSGDRGRDAAAPLRRAPSPTRNPATRTRSRTHLG